MSGKILAAASHKEIELFDVKSGAELRTIKVTFTSYPFLAFSEDEKTLAVGHCPLGRCLHTAL
jgi:hypothetical protein